MKSKANCYQKVPKIIFKNVKRLPVDVRAYIIIAGVPIFAAKLVIKVVSILDYFCLR